MRLLILASSLALALGACGGDDDGDGGNGGNGGGASGVDASAQVGELSAGDLETLCTWSAQTQGGAGETYDCGEGVTVTVSTVDECVAEAEAYAGCDLTVGTLEDCIIAWDDLCQNPPAECQALLECALGGS